MDCRLIIPVLCSLTACADVQSQSQALTEAVGLGVAYQPRGFRETPSIQYPTAEEVRADLELLRRAGFRALVTYGAADILVRVPQIARDVGFDRLVVMGIWDPTSREELANALAQAEFVDAYAVGNEGLGKRYSREELTAAMSRLRSDSGKPVSTSERLDAYVGGPDAEWLVDNSDWIFPNAHPYWAGHRAPSNASRWIVTHYDYLTATSAKRVILKEVGLPTSGDPCCDEDDQTELFRRTVAAGVQFFFFEAFDQPFKLGAAVEGHWGLFHANGSPKPVIQWLSGRAAPDER